jgi:hypothetical protein
MIGFLCGAALLVGSLAAFRRLLPRAGMPHPLAIAPYLQVAIPIALVSALVIGTGLIATSLAAGIAGLSPT